MADNLVYFSAGLPGIPEELLLARDRGEVLFIVGAGVSRPEPTNLPAFNGLVKEIYAALDYSLAKAVEAAEKEESPLKKLEDDPQCFGALDTRQCAELRRFLLGDFDIALGMLERRLDTISGENSAVRIRAAEVLGATKKINNLHQSLVRLGQRNNQVFIATTNFDLLLEEAAKEKHFPSISHSLPALPRPSKQLQFNGVFHIHGSVSGAGAAMVLTDQDFGDVYLRRRIASDFIYDVARIFNIVLVGYSLNDAPMRYLLNAIAGDELHFSDIKKRYAFVPVKNNDLRTEEDWRGREIIPIGYNEAYEHLELQTLFSAWASTAPVYGNTKWAEGALKRITKNTVDAVLPDQMSLFRYLIKRATPHERSKIVKVISAAGASYGWLDEINRLAAA